MPAKSTKTAKPKSAYAEWCERNKAMETAPRAMPAAKPFSIFADTSSDRNRQSAPSHVLTLQSGFKDMHGYQD